MQRISTGYSARKQFVPFHTRKQRWAALVAHRRAGKTVACINDLIDAALRSTKPEPRFAYIAPYFTQAKDVAWTYLKRYTAKIPGVETNESELRVDLPNKARIRLYGAENYDRLRGIYLDGVILDEPADMDPRAWSEVIRPALSDRNGWAAFIGTPKGRNDFWRIYDEATRDETWFSTMLKASQTGLLPDSELTDARKSMTEDQYEQEYECSFQAALLGAYFGKEINTAEVEGRVGNVNHEPKVKVHTSWDLGVDDSTAIWFCQQVGSELRLIDYYESSGEGIGHYAAILKSKPYEYGEHLLPHDAAVREFSTGTSRMETFASFGITGTIVPAQSIEDGINAARMIIPRCWFDAEKCKRGLEALRSYQREFDEKLKAFKSRPRHDWASHGADAFKTLATGLPQSQGWGKLKYAPSGVV